VVCGDCDACHPLLHPLRCDHGLGLPHILHPAQVTRLRCSCMQAAWLPAEVIHT
jgi:hypothetical protein